MLTTILFDLDGSLLPMVQEDFVKAYFGLLTKKLAPLGYEPKQLIDTIWKGTGAMVANDGSCTNEQAFWKVFAGVYGEQGLKHRPLFDEFYRNEFTGAQSACGFSPLAAPTVRALRQEGYRVVLATAPIFPVLAVGHRRRGAGQGPGGGEWVATYENSTHCKPNPAYYQDILRHIQAPAEQCLMAGNDAGEDMVAATLGLDVFLLTPCLINSVQADLSVYPQGDLNDLLAYIRSK